MCCPKKRYLYEYLCIYDRVWKVTQSWYADSAEFMRDNPNIRHFRKINTPICYDERSKEKRL